MVSHWSFGHLQLKLWAKEGAGVKLTIWLPTIKSLESTFSRPPNWECNMALERSRRGLQLWFRLRCDQTQQSGVMSSQSPGTPTGIISGQFRNSNLGVPGKCAIRMQLSRGAVENTIWGKVVASLEFEPWWILWIKVPVVCPNTQGCSRMWTNHFVVCFGCRFKLDLLVPLPSLISGLLARPSTPL
jgi:hypothetical protein